MAQYGFCPSGRLFEAAACRTPILSDCWPGLEDFFRPGEEIFIANTTEEALEILDLPGSELARMAERAYDRTMSEHTAEVRARELENVLESVHSTARAGAKA